MFPYFDRSSLAPMIATVGFGIGPTPLARRRPGGHNRRSPIRWTPARREPAAMNLTYESVARKVDHSLLAPTMTPAQLEEGCYLAADYGTASVCIKPFAVP